MKIQDESTIDYLINTDKNFLVEAGAGAGKTELLTKRIISQVLRGKRLSKICAITFTNKAQAEMRDRLKKSLIKQYEENPENEYLKTALKDFPSMKISTIHSFCNYLLKVKPLEAGLKVDFNLKEEEDFNEYLGESQKIFLENEDEGARDRNFREFSIYPDFIENYYAFFNHRDYSYNVPPLDELLSKHDFSLNIAEIYDLFKHLMADNPVFYAGYTGLIKSFEEEHTLENFLQLAKQIHKDLAKKPEGVNLLLQKKSRSDWEAPFIKRADEFYIDFISSEYGIFIHNQREFADFVEKARKDDPPFLSNDELLYYSMKLTEREDSRKHFQSLFDTFYIDEFQDTDEMQVKIFFNLSAKNSGDLRDIPLKDIELRDNSLFLVGDPKQSIYGFRGADLNLYEKVKEKMDSGNSEVHILTQTYRYHERLGEEIESFFTEPIENLSPLITVKSTPQRKTPNNNSIKHIYAPKFLENENWIEEFLVSISLKLAEKGEFTENEISGVSEKYRGIINKELDNCGFSEKGEIYREIIKRNTRIDANIEYEADILRYYLKSKGRLNLTKTFLKNHGSKILTNPYDIPETFIDILKDLILQLVDSEKLTEEEREIKYKDFLILTEKNDTASRLSQSLRCSNIPVSAREMESFSENTGIESFCNTIKYLLYGDKNALVRILRLSFRMTLRDISDYIEEPFGEAKEFLDSLKLKNPLEILEYLLKNYDYLYGGEPALEEITLLETFAEKVRLKNPKTLSEMALICGETLETSTDKSFRPDNIEDAVTILNIHKAKGLEGNIVIIIGDGSDYKGSNNVFLRDEKKAYLVYREGKKEIDYSNLEGSDEIISYNGIERKKEKLRLRYVALTRAREAIFFLDINGRYENLPHMPLERFLIRENNAVESQNPILPEKKTPKKGTLPDGGIITVAPSLLNARYESINNPKPHGKIFGSIIHRSIALLISEYRYFKTFNIKRALRSAIYEVRDFNEDFIREALMDKVNFEELLSSKEPNELIFDILYEYGFEILNKLMEKLIPLIQDSNYYSEVPFKITLSPEDFEKKFRDLRKPLKFQITGIMDLVIEKEGKFKIIDFKTGSETYDLDEIYKSQISIYKFALSKIFDTSEENISTEIWKAE